MTDGCAGTRCVSCGGRGASPLLTALLTAIAVAGCATAVPQGDRGQGLAPVPATGDYRAIAVVAVAGTAKSGFEGIDRVDPADYAKAGTKALGTGASSTGLALALLPYAYAAGPAGWAAIPFLFAGAAVAGFFGGYAYSASAIGPSAQVAALQATMATVAVAGTSPGTLAAEVADDIARWTPYRAQAFATAASPGAPAAQGFDAVLQVEITQFGYAGRNGGKDIALYMTAEARLTDAASGQPVALRGLAYLSPWHAPDFWTRRDGALTKDELARASRTLADRIVEHLVLHTPWLPHSDASLQGNVCGLLPIAAPGAPTRVGAGPQPPMKVDSLTPRLAWAPLPAPSSAPGAGPPAGASAQDLRYDLRIFEELDWAPGALAYGREGLAGTEHRVERELKPATLYFWTVRVRYFADGAPRATRWSATAEPGTLAPLSPQAVYASRRGPAGIEVAGCAPQDFTPCGCLDFIPVDNWFRFRTP